MKDFVCRTINKQIENQRTELKEISKGRKNLLKYSAESLAESKKINRLIKYALYEDESFKNLVKREDRMIAAPVLFNRYAELGDRNNILRFSKNNLC